MYQIYAAYCKESGKVYVGQTSLGIQARWRGHRGAAAKSGDQSYFYNVWRKYGEQSFELEELAKAETKEDADRLEKLSIVYLRACDRNYGYNGTFGGDGGQLTEETKLKISRSHRGKKYPKLSAAKTGAGHQFYGKSLSPEHRRKIGDAHRGSNSWAFGKKFSPEHRKHISEGQRGRIPVNKGVPANRPDVTVADVVGLYLAGMSIHSLSKKFSMRRPAIRNRLKWGGVPIRKRVQA